MNVKTPLLDLEISRLMNISFYISEEPEEKELPTDKDVDNLLKYWNIYPCSICGEPLDMVTARWINGNPVCKNH